MVIEAHSGAWSPNARRVLDWIAAGQAAVSGQSKEMASLNIAQRLSIALQRENARAVLKRAAAPCFSPLPSGWASFDDQVDEDGN